MPKRRSNTISTVSAAGNGAIGASGSGMSDGIVNQLAERVNNHLREPVVVQGTSRSRDRLEDLTVNYNTESEMYNVLSGSGNTYEVDLTEERCSCPDNINRGVNCRHIRAVNDAIGLVPEQERDLDESQVMGARIRQDTRDEINRNIEGASFDDEFFYSENTEEFDRTFNNIDDSLVRYEYENVLNGNTSTFGIELEFVGGNANEIARELYALGIVSHDFRVGYHSSSVAGKWKLESDSTVSSGAGGGEIVSPVLKDTPETWRQIETICEVANRHGATVDQRCGGHVHIGMDKLDTARQRWRRFFKMVSNYEDCIYRTAGGDLGRVRSNANHYATPFSQRANEAATMNFEMDTEDDVREMTRRVSNMNRYYGINLKNIATRRAPTVEFRYFNGSLNPKQIQANVKLSAGVINASEKARWRDTEDENFKKRGKLLKNSSLLSGTRTKEKMIELLDIAFTRKSDKDAIINVLKKNNWR